MHRTTKAMQWPDLLKNFKKKEEKVSYEDAICKNCETQFNGRFCPNCGQSVNEYDKPFSFIFYNFLGDFFAFDIRFFKTFIVLIFRPGFLTKEYFDGRRVRYAPPYRLFIFVSFILFFLLQISTNRGLTKVLDTTLSSNDKIVLDSVSHTLTDSVFTKIASETGMNKNEDIPFQISSETFGHTRNLRDALNKLAVFCEQNMERETNPKEKAKWREYSRLCRSPEQAMAKILEYMSWAFFILLPVFALILKLFYIRQKQFYMRHLIFSIHLHSFIFIIITVLVAAHLIFKGNLYLFTLLLILIMPVYFVLALKKFYGQRFGKTLLKFVGISSLYNIVFWIVVVFVFFKALNIA